ncbi:MAG: hypothetical protein ABFE01_16615 [Phycisphaerales bacterium]|nr:hypothetical protein [Terriglobales bacterium]
MDLDAPEIFFDGTFDETATYNGLSVRAIVDELPAPAEGGALLRAPGRWAYITLRASEVLEMPKVQDEITDSDGQVWRVQQASPEGDAWLLLCVTDQRRNRA